VSRVVSRYVRLATHHGIADGLGGFERPIANEDGQVTEQPLLRLVEQLIAPGHRVTERPLPRWHVTWAGRQQRQPALEAGQHNHRRQHAKLRGHQLDCERQTVQPSADLDDR
jgi:hypothetical protein